MALLFNLYKILVDWSLSSYIVTHLIHLKLKKKTVGPAFANCSHLTPFSELLSRKTIKCQMSNKQLTHQILKTHKTTKVIQILALAIILEACAHFIMDKQTNTQTHTHTLLWEHWREGIWFFGIKSVNHKRKARRECKLL